MKAKVLVDITLLFVVTLVCTRSHAPDHLSQLPKVWRAGAGVSQQFNKATAHGIVSILNGLEKNLILESTRSEKDEELYRAKAPGIVVV